MVVLCRTKSFTKSLYYIYNYFFSIMCALFKHYLENLLRDKTAQAGNNSTKKPYLSFYQKGNFTMIICPVMCNICCTYCLRKTLYMPQPQVRNQAQMTWMTHYVSPTTPDLPAEAVLYITASAVFSQNFLRPFSEQIYKLL